MSSGRIAAVVVGGLLLAFAALVALYAGEPFNLASIGGLVGVVLIVRAVRATTEGRAE
ncbi:MAG TPA: hypothetical protein VM030_03200 [Acidimicrobiales bacterium]|nr:hypothetical protein [Acidimicrobiales bacterium]